MAIAEAPARPDFAAEETISPKLAGTFFSYLFPYDILI